MLALQILTGSFLGSSDVRPVPKAVPQDVESINALVSEAMVAAQQRIAIAKVQMAHIMEHACRWFMPVLGSDALNRRS